MFVSFSCSLKRTKIVSDDSTVIHQEPVKDIKTTEIKSNEIKPTSKLNQKVEQFGVIFNGSGVKTWAVLNVLKEMQRYKFPINSVVGIEWGAIPAAIYAHRQSANEVEWELSKLKNYNDSRNFINKVFAKKTIADLKFPFACPTLETDSQLIKEGELSSLLPRCVFNNQNLKTDSTTKSESVSFLKKNGADKILLVNILPNAQTVGIEADDIITIRLPQFQSTDFEKRRDVLIQSETAVKKAVKLVADKYSL